MRLFRISAYIIILFTFCNTASAQEYVYSLDVKNNVTLEEMLNAFSEKYGIQFSMPSTVLNKQVNIRNEIGASTLNDFLNTLLQDLDIEYQIHENDHVLLRHVMHFEISKETHRNFEGWVFDDQSGEPIPYALVAVEGTNIASYSSETGKFQLKVPSEYIMRGVQVSSLAYSDLNLSLLSLQQVNIILLDPKPYDIEAVTILGEKPTRTLHSINIRNDEKNFFSISKISGIYGNDIFRSLQMLSGFSANDDLSSELKIRGSDADETLIFMDGFPIYKADHFYGIFSSVNGMHISDIEVHKNAIPVEYGGRTAGMVNMKSAEEVNHFGGSADLNLLSTALNLNIPFGNGSGLILSGRTSYTDLTKNKLFDLSTEDVDLLTDENRKLSRETLLKTDPSFNFYDFNMKAIVESGDKRSIDLNLFVSNDDFSNVYTNVFEARNKNVSFSHEEKYSDKSTWENIGSSINIRQQLSDITALRLNGYYSKYSTNSALSSSLKIMRTNENKFFSFSNAYSNEISSLGAKAVLDIKANRHIDLTIGSEYVSQNTAFDLVVDTLSILSQDTDAGEINTFANVHIHNIGNWIIDAGLRTSHNTSATQTFILPQISARYIANNHLSIKSSVSRSAQFVRHISHENRLGQTLEFYVLGDENQFPVGSNTNFMFGMEYQTGKWSVDIEVFRKKMFGVIDHSFINPGFNDQTLSPNRNNNYRLFKGDGLGKGIDLTLQYQGDHFYSYMAYTLSKTTNQFKEIFRNEPFPAQNDQRHQLKWVNAYTLGNFELSSAYVFTSGRPYTDLSTLTGGDIQNINPEDRLTRLPDYHRIDVGLDYSFNLMNKKAKIGFSVFNLTNHKNVKYLQYIYAVPTNVQNLPKNVVIGTETNQLDRTYNVSLNLEF